MSEFVDMWKDGGEGEEGRREERRREKGRTEGNSAFCSVVVWLYTLLAGV